MNSSVLHHFWWPRLLLSVALMGVGAQAARAQINTEAMRLKTKKDGVRGFVAGDLIWQTGSTDVLQVGLTGRIGYQKGIHRPFLQGYYRLGQKDEVKYVHNGFLHARWPAYWHRRVASEVFSQVEFNEFKLLRLRTLTGAGVRVAAVDSKYVDLFIGSGYMFEYEDLNLTDLALHPMAGLARPRHPAKTYHHRWTNYVTLLVDVTKWVFLSNVLYAQPRFDKFSDVRVLEDLSVTFKVYKRLAVVLSFSLDWDSDPPVEVAPLDTKLVTKLKYTF